jgi:diguanylate cyclase (GGDEF)-like protein
LEPNIRLILIVSSAITLVLGIAFLAGARRPPRNAVLRRCGLGLLMLFGGCTAMASRNMAPGIVTIIMANTLLMSALVIFFSATRHLEKHQPPRPDITGWALVAIVLMLCTWYSVLAPDMAARVVLVNGVAAFLTGRIAWNVTRLALGRRGTAVTHTLSGLLWFLTFVLIVTSSATLISGQPSQDLFNPTVPLATLWVVNPLLLLLIPLTAWWVVRRGQKLDASDYLAGAAKKIQPAIEAFMARADKAVTRLVKARQPLVLALIDIDNFKAVTSEHGYAVADVLVKWLEDQITGSLRVGDELVRQDIDRFALLMPDIDQEKAVMALDTLRHRIAAGVCTVDGKDIKVTVTIGVAQPRQGRETLKDLLNATKVAIYKAHGVGRNRIETAGDTQAGFNLSELDRR